MPEPSKLYILGRRDLSASQRMVQVCHALAELMLRRGDDTAVQEWAERHMTLIVLGVENESDLSFWSAELEAQGIPSFAYTEPDLGDQITALAVHPGADRRLFRRLSLL